jgi:hypothetical protein
VLNKHFNKYTAVKLISLAGGIILVNSYLLITVFFQKENSFELIKQIDAYGTKHQQAFATTQWQLGTSLNLLAMRGYWWERMGRFTTLEHYSRTRPIVAFMLFMLMIVWLFFYYPQQKQKVILLTLIWLLSWILAHGVGQDSLFSWFNQLLYDYIPMYQWFREPQKRIGLLVIGYAISWARGLHYLFSRYSAFPSIVSYQYIAALLPVTYASVLLFGALGQLSVSEYPTSWSQVRMLVSNTVVDKCLAKADWVSQWCYSMIVFPWHAYIKMPWLPKVTWWRIMNYFWPNILFWDNIEIADIYTQSTRPESALIESYIGPQWLFWSEVNDPNMTSFIKLLKGMWISQITVVKSSDRERYSSIMEYGVEKWYLNIAFEEDDIVLYNLY